MSQQQKHLTSSKAFTLVELIVVIVILAILATIAFLSFGSQSAATRDSIRLSNMNMIYKGFEIFVVRAGLFPKPEDSINISSYGNLLTMQGNAGLSNLSLINMSPDSGKDPLDKKAYSMTVPKNQQGIQIAGELEENTSTLINYLEWLDHANAETKNRYIYVIGKPLGMFFDKTDGSPAQDKKQDIDIATTETGYTVKFSNNTTEVSGTGIILSLLETNVGCIYSGCVYDDQLKEGTSSLRWRDFPGSNCTNDDYVFSTGGTTYTWAGCNSVLGSGVEWGKLDNGTDGIISGCYDYNNTNTIGNCPIGGASMASTASEKSWSVASGVSGAVNNIWGKLYTWDQANQAINACPAGWHLPSDNEFEILETYLNGGVNCRNATDGWLCSGLGWSGNDIKTSSNNIVKALKIPLGGYRATDGVTFMARGNNGYLWSSSSSGATAYSRTLRWDYDTIYRFLITKSYSIPVRCIKD